MQPQPPHFIARKRSSRSAILSRRLYLADLLAQGYTEREAVDEAIDALNVTPPQAIAAMRHVFRVWTVRVDRSLRLKRGRALAALYRLLRKANYVEDGRLVLQIEAEIAKHERTLDALPTEGQRVTLNFEAVTRSEIDAHHEAVLRRAQEERPG